MAQMPHHIDLGSGATTILRDVLHLIADETNFDQVAVSLLTAAQELTHADAAYFVLLDAPNTHVANNIVLNDIPDDEVLRETIQTLPNTIHITSEVPIMPDIAFHGAAIAPIRIRRANVAIFVLLFKDSIDIIDENLAILESILNGLKVVTQHARAHARQDRIMRNQNEFVRIVSHDLRSPLTSMQGFASMLLSQVVGDLNEKQSHFVDKILSGISQMTALVDNIQDAGRYDPETGFYEMERTPTDLAMMVQRIVDSHILPAEKESLAVAFSIADDLPIVNIDATMLERSITNLVDNAIKYTPNGGQIEVIVRHVENTIVITVEDNGYGISAEDQRKLFERHVRIRRQEHKRIKGSGLGLFIVKSVAQQHGGEAWVESEEGIGSKFSIRIPLSGRNLIGAHADDEHDETASVDS